METARLPYVLQNLVRHHNNIVIYHIGVVRSVTSCEGLAIILAQPPEKLWIKVSAPYHFKQHLHSVDGRSLKESLDSLYQIYSSFVGPERLIWGSYWPFTQFEDDVSYSVLVRNYTS